MLITELIDNLNKFKAEHGDLRVMRGQQYGDCVEYQDIAMPYLTKVEYKNVSWFIYSDAGEDVVCL